MENGRALHALPKEAIKSRERAKIRNCFFQRGTFGSCTVETIKVNELLVRNR